MLLLRPSVRRALAIVLALVGSLAFITGSAEIGAGVQGSRGAWIAVAVFAVFAGACWMAALRLARSPRSRAAASGHLVLFETPMPGATLSQTPPLTIRGARDAVERFIPREEFGELFGGWALWAASAHPTHDLPGEALGVWSQRVCKRFRRILRERGARLEVRREPGPAQRLAQLVSRPGPRNRTR
jgi:hypothetical protein